MKNEILLLLEGRRGEERRGEEDMRIWFSDAREVEEMGCYIDKRGSGS
jgi:hypothetical protein